MNKYSSWLVLPSGLGAKSKRHPRDHFGGQDRVYDGIRYLQQPMGYPSDGHREEKPLRLWPKKSEKEEACVLERSVDEIFCCLHKMSSRGDFFCIQEYESSKPFAHNRTVQNLVDP